MLNQTLDERRMGIRIKTRDEVERMRAAGRVVFKTLERCREVCKLGVTTAQIDQEGYKVYTDAGAVGLFKGYPTYQPGEGFPGNLCISVNEEVVHGIPGPRVIKEGDIVSIDCGVRLDGWCGDAATTVMVGKVKPDVRRLCETTKHVLNLAIQNIRPGMRWSQVARLMQSYAERAGYSVVRDFVGHGVGQEMHEEPRGVPNFVSREMLKGDFVMQPGMVIAVEPMCNLGVQEVVTLADGWTVVTADRQPAAHYEHTVAITPRGADILTDGR